MTYQPIHPDLEQFRALAGNLHAACTAGDQGALARVADQCPGEEPTLSAARLAVAREHGFESWSEMERATELASQLRDALDPGDPDAVRAIVAEVPQLADCVPWPTHRPNTRALEIVADACVWHRPRKHAVAQVLIEAGATCDIPLAARAGSIESVRDMLEREPGLIDSCDEGGRTALYRAGCVYGAFKEGEDVVDLLLEMGAQPDIFVAATFAMADRVAELLVDNDALAQSTDPDGMTALHWALRPRGAKRHEGHDPIRVTRLLLEAGADVHAIDPTQEGMLPIHHFGEWGAAHVEQVDALLEYGADINAKSTTGWTALDYALDRSRVEIAELLKVRGGAESGER